jgi:hypothetical protein
MAKEARQEGQLRVPNQGICCLPEVRGPGRCDRMVGEGKSAVKDLVGGRLPSFLLAPTPPIGCTPFSRRARLSAEIALAAARRPGSFRAEDQSGHRGWRNQSGCFRLPSARPGSARHSRTSTQRHAQSRELQTKLPCLFLRRVPHVTITSSPNAKASSSGDRSGKAVKYPS